MKGAKFVIPKIAGAVGGPAAGAIAQIASDLLLEEGNLEKLLSMLGGSGAVSAEETNGIEKSKSRVEEILHELNSGLIKQGVSPLPPRGNPVKYVKPLYRVKGDEANHFDDMYQMPNARWRAEKGLNPRFQHMAKLKPGQFYKNLVKEMQGRSNRADRNMLQPAPSRVHKGNVQVALAMRRAAIAHKEGVHPSTLPEPAGLSDPQTTRVQHGRGPIGPRTNASYAVPMAVVEETVTTQPSITTERNGDVRIRHVQQLRSVDGNANTLWKPKWWKPVNPSLKTQQGVPTGSLGFFASMGSFLLQQSQYFDKYYIHSMKLIWRPMVSLTTPGRVCLAWIESTRVPASGMKAGGIDPVIDNYDTFDGLTYKATGRLMDPLELRLTDEDIGDTNKAARWKLLRRVDGTLQDGILMDNGWLFLAIEGDGIGSGILTGSIALEYDISLRMVDMLPAPTVVSPRDRSMFQLTDAVTSVASGATALATFEEVYNDLSITLDEDGIMTVPAGMYEFELIVPYTWNVPVLTWANVRVLASIPVDHTIIPYIQGMYDLESLATSQSHNHSLATTAAGGASQQAGTIVWKFFACPTESVTLLFSGGVYDLTATTSVEFGGQDSGPPPGSPITLFVTRFSLLY